MKRRYKTGERYELKTCERCGKGPPTRRFGIRYQQFDKKYKGSGRHMEHWQSLSVCKKCLAHLIKTVKKEMEL